MPAGNAPTLRADVNYHRAKQTNKSLFGEEKRSCTCGWNWLKGEAGTRPLLEGVDGVAK